MFQSVQGIIDILNLNVEVYCMDPQTIILIQMRNFRPHACDFESISLERDTVDPYQIEHDFVTIWGFFPFFRYFLKKASCIANYDFWKKPVQSNKISYIAESEVHFNGKKH